MTARFKANPTSWLQAKQFLNRNPDGKIAHNTFIVALSYDDIGLIYYNTCLVRWSIWPGKIVLNSGGWRTSTTKDRINAVLPEGWKVYQKNHRWYVKKEPEGIVHSFFDGMVI